MSTTLLNTSAAFDSRGLDALKRQTVGRSAEAITSAAKQMEGLFIQMMLKSMRDATGKEGLFHSSSAEMFTSMYDQQLSQDLAAKSELGFADMMLKEMGGTLPKKTTDTLPAEAATLRQFIPARAKPLMSGPFPLSPISPPEQSGYLPAASDKQNDFINRLLQPAISAAQNTGIPHQLIIAQAALESGWGKSEILTSQGKPSHNLFGIKASGDWQGDTTEITTTEYIDGVAKKVKAVFRVYASYSEALADYGGLLVNNPRYQHVANSGTAERGAQALQRGGYATDPRYADKLINIIQKVKVSVNQGINAYKTDLSALF